MQNKALKSNISGETISAIFIITFLSLFILVNLTVGFSWPLYLLAMAIGFLVSANRPQSGLLAIVFLIIVFERFFTLQSIFIGKVEYKIYPLDILMLGILAGIVFQVLFRGKKIKFSKADKWLVGFIILNAVYFLFSVLVLGSDFNLAGSTLKNYAFYSLFYFIVSFLVRTENDLKKLFKFFLAGAIGIIAFIAIGIARGEGLWSEYTPLSTSGIRLLAFTHGFYLTLAIFLALAYLLFRKNKASKAWYFLLLVWAVGIAGTMMRHLWASVAVTVVLLYFMFSQEKKKDFRRMAFNFLVLFMVMAVLVFYALSLAPHSKLGDLTDKVFGVLSERVATLTNASEDESFSWRRLVWKIAYEKYKESPLLGIGIGGKIYAETENYKDFIEVRSIHNSYLSILIQFGLAGLAVFLYFVYQNVKKMVRFAEDGKYGWYKLSILGIVSVYGIALLFQPYLETNLLAIFFWMALGIARNLTANFEPEIYENTGNQQI